AGRGGGGVTGRRAEGAEAGRGRADAATHGGRSRRPTSPKRGWSGPSRRLMGDGAAGPRARSVDGAGRRGDSWGTEPQAHEPEAWMERAVAATHGGRSRRPTSPKRGWSGPSRRLMGDGAAGRRTRSVDGVGRRGDSWGTEPPADELEAWMEWAVAATH